MSCGVPFLLSAARFAEMISSPESSRQVRGKEWARARIAGERTLSVPLCGGASQLKSSGCDIFDIAISDHGRWREEHLGALKAAYGRTPFFSHLFPLIEERYSQKSHASLGAFNESLFSLAAEFLDIESIAPALSEMRLNNPRRYASIRSELIRNVNLNYSIFDALFRLGKDTTFII